MSVGMMLVALRIRRKISGTVAQRQSSEIEALVAETLHALSVLVSVDPSLEPLVEKNKIAKAV